MQIGSTKCLQQQKSAVIPPSSQRLNIKMLSLRKEDLTNQWHIAAFLCGFVTEKVPQIKKFFQYFVSQKINSSDNKVKTTRVQTTSDPKRILAIVH